MSHRKNNTKQKDVTGKIYSTMSTEIRVWVIRERNEIACLLKLHNYVDILPYLWQPVFGQ